ncbi:MAG: hypothetical protein COW30_14275 [Rhodospirillales bacterium CG15_BIG_FIL_POST_REV_8_21_14_020_66_15]|nr:MAG: hypothetical protein COW30_14275 [Rhodospirillales bacterium CG15_BIG_FIL_POST_REV_8_21_14_020_66_15]
MALVTEPENDDARAVRAAAAILNLSEYDLFQLAFERWWGRPPRNGELEPAFVAFLFDQGTPHWARHFARRVLDEAEAGTLDRAALGAGRFKRVVPLPTRARPPLSVTLLLLAVYVLGAAAIHYRIELKSQACDVLARGGWPALIAAALVEGEGALCGKGRTEVSPPAPPAGGPR